MKPASPLMGGRTRRRPWVPDLSQHFLGSADSPGVITYTLFIKFYLTHRVLGPWNTWHGIWCTELFANPILEIDYLVVDGRNIFSPGDHWVVRGQRCQSAALQWQQQQSGLSPSGLRRIQWGGDDREEVKVNSRPPAAPQPNLVYMASNEHWNATTSPSSSTESVTTMNWWCSGSHSVETRRR